MFALCLSWWTAVWAISFSQLYGVFGGACDGCSFHGADFARVYAWSEDGADHGIEGGSPNYGLDTITLTQTIVTVINTVLDTNRTTTLINYPAEATNDAGTRTETITYSRQGETHTTILTFPHPFVVWADTYTWISASDCNGNITSGTVTLKSNPQSDWYDLLPSMTGSYNPQGSRYGLRTGIWDDYLYNAYSDQFPDQSIFQSCTSDGFGGPAFGGYTSTDWMYETSISIEGSEQTSVATSGTSTSSPLSPSSIDTTQPTVTSSGSTDSTTESTAVQSPSVSPTSSNTAGVTAKILLRTIFVVTLSDIILLAML